MTPFTLINPFEIPRGQEIAFVANWRRASDYFTRQEGFISTRLHRCHPASRFRFTNIAVWETREHFLRAIQSSEFRTILGDLELPHFPELFDFMEAPIPRTQELEACGGPSHNDSSPNSSSSNTVA